MTPHFLKKIMKQLLAPMLGLIVMTHSLAAMADQPSKRLLRQPGQERVLQTSLNQDVFRQESYEDTYEVQVPYTVTESYEVDVPYTDWEDYWDQEYRCRNVPGFREECHDQELCAPGSNRTECRVVRTCQQVPTNEQVCHWEQVRKTRQVTRYRKETRYREVTKYRTETRCCVTKTRDVFDHKWVMDVELQFPPQADLRQGETEELSIEMTGTEQNPNLVIRPISAIFGYKVTNKSVTAQKAFVTLEVIPRFSREDLAESSIGRIDLRIDNNGSKLIVEDSGIAPRVVSTYRFQILGLHDQRLVEEGSFRPGAGRNEISLSRVQKYTDYKVILSVVRDGEVIEGGHVEFVKTADLPFERLSVSDYARPEQVRLVDIRGQGQNSMLVFNDNSPIHERVKSVYKIKISRKGGFLWRKTIGMGGGTLYREKLTAREGQYSIALSDLGVSSGDLKKHLTENSRVKVEIEVIRNSEIFREKPTASFSKDETFIID